MGRGGETGMRQEFFSESAGQVIEMGETGKLTEEQIEELAYGLREILISEGLWRDVDIFFNSKELTQRDPDSGQYFDNDRGHLIELENINPRKHVDHAARNHILSMAFDGDVLDMFHKRGHSGVRERISLLLERYGVYYEFGEACTLTCYYIHDWGRSCEY